MQSPKKCAEFQIDRRHGGVRIKESPSPDALVLPSENSDLQGKFVAGGGSLTRAVSVTDPPIVNK